MRFTQQTPVLAGSMATETNAPYYLVPHRCLADITAISIVCIEFLKDVPELSNNTVTSAGVWHLVLLAQGFRVRPLYQGRQVALYPLRWASDRIIRDLRHAHHVLRDWQTSEYGQSCARVAS